MLSSTEPQQVGRFILRRWNTYSSHAHTTAGAYVLVRSTDTKGPVSSVLFGASLLVLSLLSHAWWASRRRLACHVDNLFMEAHIVALSLVIVSPAIPPAYCMSRGSSSPQTPVASTRVQSAQVLHSSLAIRHWHSAFIHSLRNSSLEANQSCNEIA